MSVSPEDTEGQTHSPIVNSPGEAVQNTSNAVVIGGAVVGSLAVIVVDVFIAVVVVLLVRK